MLTTGINLTWEPTEEGKWEGGKGQRIRVCAQVQQRTCCLVDASFHLLSASIFSQLRPNIEVLLLPPEKIFLKALGKESLSIGGFITVTWLTTATVGHVTP